MPTPISVRLDEETGKRLDRLAKETGRTKAFYIRKMIEERIDDMEDYYLAAKLHPTNNRRRNLCKINRMILSLNFLPADTEK